jgi:hypothetical protein
MTRFMTLLLMSVFFLFPSHPTHAGLFSTACGEGITQRPACTPISADKYNPDAYSQIPIKDDCSNYCFDSERGFSSEPIINMTTVTCGAPIIATLTRIGDVLQNQFPDPVINREAGVGVAGITSLSLATSDRANQPAWYRLLNELGSVWTNTRGSAADRNGLLEYGKNPLSRGFEQQLKDRMDFCGNLKACQTSNYADFRENPAEGMVDRQGLPSFRCVNPQPYDAYPFDDRQDIVNELDICNQAETELLPFETNPKKNLSDYFVSCNGRNSATCNPTKDDTFARRFLELEPTVKARELMVICTDVYTEFETDTFNKFRGEASRNFDCQEVIIPPGLIAACQGLWRQYQITAPLAYHERISPSLEAPIKELSRPDSGEVVHYKAGYFEKLLNSQKKRMEIYAGRINAEGNQCLEDEQDSETYGDANHDIGPSDPTRINTALQIKDPNSGNVIGFRAKRTFIIAPPGFDQCFNRLAHTSDESLSKFLTPYSTYNQNEGVKYVQLNMPHPMAMDDKFSTNQNCEYRWPDGKWRPTLPPNKDPDEVKKECQHWELEYETTEGENRLYTEGGNKSRYLFLEAFKKFRTSAFAKDWAGDRICDWFAYTHRLPAPPGCQGSMYNNPPALIAPSGSLKEFLANYVSSSCELSYMLATINKESHGVLTFTDEEFKKFDTPDWYKAAGCGPISLKASSANCVRAYCFDTCTYSDCSGARLCQDNSGTKHYIGNATCTQDRQRQFIMGMNPNHEETTVMGAAQIEELTFESPPRNADPLDDKLMNRCVVSNALQASIKKIRNSIPQGLSCNQWTEEVVKNAAKAYLGARNEKYAQEIWDLYQGYNSGN